MRTLSGEALRKYVDSQDMPWDSRSRKLCADIVAYMQWYKQYEFDEDDFSRKRIGTVIGSQYPWLFLAVIRAYGHYDDVVLAFAEKGDKANDLGNWAVGTICFIEDVQNFANIDDAVDDLGCRWPLKLCILRSRTGMDLACLSDPEEWYFYVRRFDALYPLWSDVRMDDGIGFREYVQKLRMGIDDNSMNASLDAYTVAMLRVDPHNEQWGEERAFAEARQMMESVLRWMVYDSLDLLSKMGGEREVYRHNDSYHAYVHKSKFGDGYDGYERVTGAGGRLPDSILLNLARYGMLSGIEDGAYYFAHAGFHYYLMQKYAGKQDKVTLDNPMLLRMLAMEYLYVHSLPVESLLVRKWITNYSVIEFDREVGKNVKGTYILDFQYPFTKISQMPENLPGRKRFMDMAHPSKCNVYGYGIVYGGRERKKVDDVLYIPLEDLLGNSNELLDAITFQYDK